MRIVSTSSTTGRRLLFGIPIPAALALFLGAGVAFTTSWRTRTG